MTINTISPDGFDAWLAAASFDSALAELPHFVPGWPDRVQWVIYGLYDKATTAAQRERALQQSLLAMLALAMPHGDTPANILQALHVFERLAECCQPVPSQRAELTQAGFSMLPKFVQVIPERAETLVHALARLNSVDIGVFKDLAGYADGDLWLISAPAGHRPTIGFAQCTEAAGATFYIDDFRDGAKALLARGAGNPQADDPASDPAFRNFAYTVLARQHETGLPSLAASAHQRLTGSPGNRSRQLAAA